MAGLLTGLMIAAAPKVGEVAPDFTATDTDGQTRQLSQLLAKGPVVLAFFPKAFTGG